jgi:hypothetical protein
MRKDHHSKDLYLFNSKEIAEPKLYFKFSRVNAVLYTDGIIKIFDTALGALAFHNTTHALANSITAKDVYDEIFDKSDDIPIIIITNYEKNKQKIKLLSFGKTTEIKHFEETVIKANAFTILLTSEEIRILSEWCITYHDKFN